jgi:Tfp pilus assembly protein PilP
VRRVLTVILAAPTLTAVLAAQGVAQQPAARAQTPQAQKPVAEAPLAEAPEPFTYRADGRRDPFRSLIGTGDEPRPVARKGEGLASLLLAEISVRGVMQSRDALVAMIAGPDNKTYVVHAGDKLFDGTIKSITSDGLVVSQRVTDPLSGVKQRDVHKMLRSLEDAKE